MTDVSRTLPWMHPLNAARALPPDAPFVLLYSGLRADYSGGVSWLACGEGEVIQGNDFAPLAARLTGHLPPQENAWFGYLGYELNHALERLPQAAPGIIHLPPLWMTRFSTRLRFDHSTQTLTCYGPEPLFRAEPPAAVPPLVTMLSSNMSKAEYFHACTAIIEAIHAGELYQANLTRKFHGTFDTSPDAAALFARLADISPSPYSALIYTGDAWILSSSPERFLTVDAAGRATARPIKGSAPRGHDAAEDARLREQLLSCPKNRAENLMIVDLMRNDLARTCLPGSVKVESLFDLTAHPTVHHLSSTITGQRRTDASALDLVQACFPPGSMTGAPKIRAMQLCTRLEGMCRGVYSGALGWFGGDGSADLSVVIRTLVIQGNRFEFQVGGGIVADSTPEGEWRETLVKSRALARTLGIEEAQLEGI